MIINECLGERVSTAADVAKVLFSIMETVTDLDRDKEHFWVIGVNVKNAIKFIELISLGTLTSSLIHPSVNRHAKLTHFRG